MIRVNKKETTLEDISSMQDKYRLLGVREYVELDEYVRCAYVNKSFYIYGDFKCEVEIGDELNNIDFMLNYARKLILSNTNTVIKQVKVEEVGTVVLGKSVLPLCYNGKNLVHGEFNVNINCKGTGLYMLAHFGRPLSHINIKLNGKYARKIYVHSIGTGKHIILVHNNKVYVWYYKTKLGFTAVSDRDLASKDDISGDNIMVSDELKELISDNEDCGLISVADCVMLNGNDAIFRLQMQENFYWVRVRL